MEHVMTQEFKQVLSNLMRFNKREIIDMTIAPDDISKEEGITYMLMLGYEPGEFGDYWVKYA